MSSTRDREMSSARRTDGSRSACATRPPVLEAVTTKQQVVDHRCALEQVRCSETSGQYPRRRYGDAAMPGYRGRAALSVQRVGVKTRVMALNRVVFPGTVRSDDREYLALLDRKTEIANGDETAKSATPDAQPQDSSPVALRSRVRLATAECVAPIERKRVEKALQLDPSAVEAERLKQDEQGKHQTEDKNLETELARDLTWQESA